MREIFSEMNAGRTTDKDFFEQTNSYLFVFHNFLVSFVRFYNII